MNRLLYLLLVFVFSISCKNKYELLGEYKHINSGEYPRTIWQGAFFRLERIDGDVRYASAYFIGGKLMRDTFFLNKKTEMPLAHKWVYTHDYKYDSTRYMYTLRETSYQKLKQNLTLRIDEFYTLVLSMDTSIMKILRNDTLRNMYLPSMTKHTEIDRYIYYKNLILLAGRSTEYFHSWDTCIKVSGKDIYSVLKINNHYLRKVRKKYEITASPYIKYYWLPHPTVNSIDSFFQR